VDQKPSAECLSVIREFEGLRLTAYPDPGSGGEPWTIGYGHTGGVRAGARCSLDQAEAWLARDAQEAAQAVLRLVKVPMVQCELDALTSFVFNLGARALAGSTLLCLLNDGDRTAAAAQFLRWTHAAGKVLPGLVRRREAERRMFLGLDWRGDA
jgi:lysozyme